MSRKYAEELTVQDTLKTAALLAALTGIAALVGYAILGAGGLLVSVAGVALLSAAGLGVPPSWVLRLQGGRPLSAWDSPALDQMVRRLAARASIPIPNVFLLPSAAANAVAVGGGERAPGALGVTTGALHGLEPDELEGVLAHEIAHLKNRDTDILRIAMLISAAVSALLRVALWTALFVTLIAGADLGYVLRLTALAITAPFAITWLRAALSRTREFAADTTAASLTGKPWALASALRRIDGYQSGLLRLLFGTRPSSPFDSHPATAERVERLLAMSPKPTHVRHPVALPVTRLGIRPRPIVRSFFY